MTKLQTSSVKNQRGEFTVDTAFRILIGTAALALVLSIAAVVFQANKLSAMASDLTRMVELDGEINYAQLQSHTALLASSAGLNNVTCEVELNGTAAYDGQRVQFGTDFILRLHYTGHFGIGGLLSVPVPLTSSVVGRSERYWK